MSALSSAPGSDSPSARVFLGWNAPQLPALADWLLADGGGTDFSSTVVILSGARAGRRFRQILAQKCAGSGTLMIPPQVVTPVHAVPAVFSAPEGILEPASDLVCRIAWAQALAELPESHGKLLSAAWQCGSGWASAGMMALAESLHACASEVIASGKSPADVAAWIAAPERGSPDEAVARWGILADLWCRYVKILRTRKLTDPTLWRRTLLFEGTRRNGIRLVLAGLVEMDGMYSAGFARVGGAATVVVFAPESERAGFDAWGQLRPDFWKGRPVQLNHGQLMPVADAAAQGGAVGAFFSVEHFPGDLAVCACDESDVPRLTGRLKSEGIRLRPPAHVTFGQSRPWQVLGAIADFLDRPAGEHPEFAPVAELVRHPDIRAVLRRDWSTHLDRYAAVHVPERFAPGALEGTTAEIAADLLTELVELTGPCEGDLPMDGLHERLIGLLKRVYGPCEFNVNLPDENAVVLPIQRLMESSRATAAAVADLRMTLPDFIRILLRAHAGEAVPPNYDPGTVDVIGWLELPAEDAPLVAVTSLVDGRVPARVVTEDAFLPGRVRRDLGIHDDASRMARDIYILTAASAWRGSGLRLMVPRRDSRGEPTRPSRIVLAGLKGRALASRWIGLVDADVGQNGDDSSLGGLAKHSLRVPEPSAILHERPTVLRVSSFRTYLESPRLFFFRHVLGLSIRNDELTDLDPASTGSIIHEILGEFGWDRDARDETNSKAIENYLHRALDDLWSKRFNQFTTPAVQFHKESISRILSMFSVKQAELRNQGWRIVWSEGGERTDAPSAPLVTADDGRVISIQGRCDRIDFLDHAPPDAVRWRVIDYKTAAKPKDPETSHRKKRAENPWIDLQMPLYHRLFPAFVQTFGLNRWEPGEPVDLCYFQLPEDAAKSGISKPFPPEWIGDENDDSSAIAAACQVARAVAEGRFDEVGTPSPYTEMEFSALCGLGAMLLGEPEEDSDDD